MNSNSLPPTSFFCGEAFDDRSIRRFCAFKIEKRTMKKLHTFYTKNTSIDTNDVSGPLTTRGAFLMLILFFAGRSALAALDDGSVLLRVVNQLEPVDFAFE